MARVTQQMRTLYGLCAVALVERRADLDGADDVGFDIDLPVFSVGLVAQLANIHPQTLRQYDRQELVVPQRTEGGARRYSLRDVDRLVQAQRLSQDEGINLAGIAHILRLQEENRQLTRELQRLKNASQPSIFAADADGGITEIQHSRQARHWRDEVRGRTRELPMRPWSPETSDEDLLIDDDTVGFSAGSAERDGDNDGDHNMDVRCDSAYRTQFACARRGMAAEQGSENVAQALGYRPHGRHANPAGGADADSQVRDAFADARALVLWHNFIA